MQDLIELYLSFITLPLIYFAKLKLLLNIQFNGEFYLILQGIALFIVKFFK